MGEGDRQPLVETRPRGRRPGPVKEGMCAQYALRTPALALSLSLKSTPPSALPPSVPSPARFLSLRVDVQPCTRAPKDIAVYSHHPIITACGAVRGPQPVANAFDHRNSGRNRPAASLHLLHDRKVGGQRTVLHSSNTKSNFQRLRPV